MSNDNAAVDHSGIQSNVNYEDEDDELSRFFDFELSSKKFHKSKNCSLSIEVCNR